MEKSYNPGPLEKKWRTFWIENEKFKSPAGGGGKRPAFSIVMPPPNVTGSLHIGHALNNTLQDVLVRYKKMKGFDVLWVPGTDHAGIATQMVVERELAKEGGSREDLGKEAFLEKVLEFKEQSSEKILEQIRTMGFIPDWSRERFTMDDGFSEAVKSVFVDLYGKGFIRRDNRLVNYDPGLKTAVSDLEVEQKEVPGHYWHIKYPFKNGEGSIVVATTRPETMLGDVAVAVHPEDERYKKLVGTEVELPLTGKTIPIIADEYSDPEKGSGAVKITPAHDFNDFEVGRRHDLPLVNIFDEDMRLNENVPGKYGGVERFEARKQLLKDLEAGGFLEKTEEISHTVPYGDRSGAVIEPRLMEQWYMEVSEFAREAVKAVEEGKMKFHPKFWERTYFRWMNDIEPWCISRQLWWGHQIPAWYGPDGEVFVEKDEETARKLAEKHYGKQVELTRDSNVLDTWFSSALWPFATMDWPRENALLEKYYPTSVLITGFDIIFFWVARMAMMGIQFTGRAPFTDIYIHGLVRDEKGEKMSKTKGNVIDPLEIANEFGADALRFCLCALTSGGRDIDLSISAIRGYRNFMNKVWNASRFILETGDADTEEIKEILEPDFSTNKDGLSSADKWIIAAMNIALKKIDGYMENYEFGKAAQEIYRFFWRDLCDRYIETAKISIYGDDPARAKTAARTLFHTLYCSARTLHPFCPHLAEEINDRIRQTLGARPLSLLDLDYPVCDEKIARDFSRDHENMSFLFEGLVDEIRARRGTAGIKVSEKIEVFFLPEKGKGGKETRDLIESCSAVLEKLAGMSSFSFCSDEEEFSHLEGFECPVSFTCESGAEDKPGKRFNIRLKIKPEKTDESRERRDAGAVRKELEEVSKKLLQSERKLADPEFKNKAPEKVVSKEKGKLEEFARRKEVLEAELKETDG
ncbi:MAG: valine--tRNA ligase [Thermodesulfobacteriota bacterium]